MSHPINIMTSQMTPTRQIRKVSIDEIPNAPIKEKLPMNNLNVVIPKFKMTFDEDTPLADHETRLHRKTSYWNSQDLSFDNYKK
jgi:hypothetical protein